ncbi:MAG TPA: uroporphyrinogen-III synthase [Pseudoxanthomonas sp.]|nr:uroporphyrinogen-III synthase [Pseudoxanthomonas sp.]
MADTKNEGWYVISLRPSGDHETLRRAAARRGARLLALSPWRIQLRDDAATRAALAQALDAERVLFTSPAAVTAAASLQTLQARSQQIWLAVGAGTAQALHQHGITQVRYPTRMDSEGLLALPELQQLRGARLGFVTAPDGRNVLAPRLAERGAQLLRADVYARQDLPLLATAVARLQNLAGHACILISSGGALDRVLAQLPPEPRAAMLALPAVAASERLAEHAHATGFLDVITAAGPQPAQLLDAAATRRRAAIR